MSNHLDTLIERTIKLAQELAGDVVEGTLEKARRRLARNAAALAVGIAAIVIAIVFGAIGATRWLETIVSETHRWTPPVIVALILGVAGWASLRSTGGRREP